jgi:hypothetical protein
LGAIEDNLSSIRLAVEKALVKVGSANFSRLHFPAHMQTPITDILSWIIMKDKIDLEEVSSIIYDDKDKYAQNIGLLIDTGLVRKVGSQILPNNPLIEIESKNKPLNETLADAITYFFSRGYGMEGVRQVIGPHLTISAFCYEKAFEYSSIVPVTYNELEEIVADRYGQASKLIKIPRYLIQLEDVGLLKEKVIGNEIEWIGFEEIFSKMKSEDEILESVQKFFV